MEIKYSDSLDGMTPERLVGFFVGWPNPPSPATHLEILRKIDQVVLALNDVSGRVVGFINALTDHIHCAYLPLLEVLPEYQGRGIGSELVRRMLQKLEGIYMIDLACDPSVQPFYERLALIRSTGMTRRDFSVQNGRVHR